MGQQAPLQGQATYTPRPFSAIIEESGDQWEGLNSQQKYEVLDAYLENRRAKDPQFQALDNNQYREVRTDFTKKFVFNQDLMQQGPTQTGSPLDVATGLVTGMGEQGSYIASRFAALNPDNKLFGRDVSPYDATQLPQYQNNPYFRVGRDIGNPLAQLGNVATFSRFLGPVGGALTESANRNQQDFASGRQNAGQAVFNTGLDTVLGKLAPQSRTILMAALKDAGIGGIGSGIGYAGNQVLTGQQINPAELLRAMQTGAASGAAIGGGVKVAQGAPLGLPKGKQPKATVTYKGRAVKQQAPLDRVIVGSPGQVNQRAFDNAVTTVINLRRQGMKQQANALIQRLGPEVKQAVEAFEVKNKARQQVKNEQLKQAVAKLGPQKGRAAELDALKQDIANRNKQVIKTANIQKVQKERLPGKAKMKDLTAEKQVEIPTGKAQDTKTIRKEIKAARKSGETVVIQYKAEKFGETGEYQYKTVHDADIEINNRGDVQVRGVNAEGQLRTYLEKDASGSEIVSIQRTGEPNQYVRATDPDTGKMVVKDINTGEIVAQVKKEGKKSSEIQAELAKMEDLVRRAKEGKSTSVSEIMDASKKLDDAEFNKLTKDMTPEELAEFCRRFE